MQEIVRELYKADKPIAAICQGVQVQVATPEVIRGKRVAGLFTTRPEVEMAGAIPGPIGGKDALRDRTRRAQAG